MSTDPDQGSPTPFNPTWKENRILEHLFHLRALPDPSDLSSLSTDPWFDGIDRRHRDRARYFHAFSGAYAALGVAAGELRLPFEPLHPLPASDLADWVASTLEGLGADHPVGSYGFGALSRRLVDSYNPAADLLYGLDLGSNSEDLLLFDPLTGFAIWPDNGRIRNAWVGNRRDLTEALLLPPPLKSLLYQSEADHFTIGKSLMLRAVGPLLRQRREIRYDIAGIPTVTVATQRDLEALASDLAQACERSPLAVNAVFRGQSSEYFLPNRLDLALKGICSYSDVTDHSLVPSLYRKYDNRLNDLADFRAFIEHLLDWGLWADLIFGNPATITTLDGLPYSPKPIPDGGATASFSFMFSGHSEGGRGTEDLGPQTKWTVSLPDGTVFDEYVKSFRPGYDSVRRSLLLQHYGAPTPFLDVTYDIRVAEWFALNKVEINEDGLSNSGPVEPPFNAPAIYVVLALEGLAPLVNTHELVTPEEALRPHRQACALLGGPGNLYRNSISRFIGLKIKFDNSFKPSGLPSANYLFPGPQEDNALRALLGSYHKPEGNHESFPVYWFPAGV